jgi:hypothetical protein
MEEQVFPRALEDPNDRGADRKREDDAMHDLVMQETERIVSRFREPACGNGNF